MGAAGFDCSAAAAVGFEAAGFGVVGFADDFADVDGPRAELRDGLAGGFFFVLVLAPAMFPPVQIIRLNRETRAAPARCRGMWIVDLKRLADQVIDEVDLRPIHVRERNRVDQYDGAAALHDDVIVSARARKVEAILEAGATTAGNGDAKSGTAGLVRQNAGDPLGCALRNGHRCDRCICHVSQNSENRCRIEDLPLWIVMERPAQVNEGSGRGRLGMADFVVISETYGDRAWYYAGQGIRAAHKVGRRGD